MKKLQTISRIILALSALMLLVSFYVPLWQILMWAPQYPEGLEMKIWIDTLSGDYKIISGLNHYIGMKHIEVDMFPEFRYMKYIVSAITVFGLIAAVVNRRAMLVAYISVIVLAGVAGMVDFYLWGYDYGHNLDPTAPIVVPGMAYQPPLIGTKQLLNFTAFSAPDTGGYIFLVSGVLAIGALYYEIRGRKANIGGVAGILFLALALSSCSASPEPLVYGKDGCHHCKMILMDKRFGAEIVTEKGKVYKFDDVNCMTAYLDDPSLASEKIKFTLVADFSAPETLLNAEEATYVFSEKIKSPMASNMAAFGEKSKAMEANAAWSGELLDWTGAAQRLE